MILLGTDQGLSSFDVCVTCKKIRTFHFEHFLSHFQQNPDKHLAHLRQQNMKSTEATDILVSLQPQRFTDIPMKKITHILSRHLNWCLLYNGSSNKLKWFLHILSV